MYNCESHREITLDQERVAIIQPDLEEGGYNVVDTRSGELLAWRGYAVSAAEIVDWLNGTYQVAPFPARDTLVHEIVGLRITGEAG